jgi:poly(A)-specific ribonuclease
LAGGDLKGLDPTWFCVDEKNEPVFTDMEALKKTIQSLQKALKNKLNILVGHNLFIDLIFIYKTFVGTLPDQVTEFNKRIHEIFPKVFDTKYLATQAGSSMRTKSGLKDLCDELKTRHKPFIALAERHVAYGLRSREHEAGYDSKPPTC